MTALAAGSTAWIVSILIVIYRNEKGYYGDARHWDYLAIGLFAGAMICYIVSIFQLIYYIVDKLS